MELVSSLLLTAEGAHPAIPGSTRPQHWRFSVTTAHAGFSSIGQSWNSSDLQNGLMNKRSASNLHLVVMKALFSFPRAKSRHLSYSICRVPAPSLQSDSSPLPPAQYLPVWPWEEWWPLSSQTPVLLPHFPPPLNTNSPSDFSSLWQTVLLTGILFVSQTISNPFWKRIRGNWRDGSSV